MELPSRLPLRAPRSVLLLGERPALFLGRGGLTEEVVGHRRQLRLRLRLRLRLTPLARLLRRLHFLRCRVRLDAIHWLHHRILLQLRCARRIPRLCLGKALAVRRLPRCLGPCEDALEDTAECLETLWLGAARILCDRRGCGVRSCTARPEQAIHLSYEIGRLRSSSRDARAKNFQVVSIDAIPLCEEQRRLLKDAELVLHQAYIRCVAAFRKLDEVVQQGYAQRVGDVKRSCRFAIATEKHDGVVHKCGARAHRKRLQTAVDGRQAAFFRRCRRCIFELC